MRGWLLVLAVLGAVAAGADARAQVSVGGDSDLDLRRDRQRAAPLGPEAASREGKDFELALTAPVLYTTLAVRESTDTVTNNKGDWHFNPDLQLYWSHQYPAAKLSAYAGVSVDRFFTESDADEDTVFGGVKAAWTDGGSDLFVPYLRYDVTVDFQPDFRSRDDTLHDLAVGASSGIGFRPGTGPIAYRDALDPGDLSVGIDARAGRRLADPSGFENSFVVLTLDALYVVSRDWSVRLTPRFRTRWYDDFFGTFRRDYRLSAILTAAWTPDWLTRLLPRAEIDLTVGFLRNFSNLSEESFHEWDVGPALSFAWRF
jgi:hypothetical protein